MLRTRRMDGRTIEYDDTASQGLTARYRAADPSFRAVLLEAFPVPGSRILDVSAGSGRALATLLEMGDDASCTEPRVGL